MHKKIRVDYSEQKKLSQKQKTHSHETVNKKYTKEKNVVIREITFFLKKFIRTKKKV